jgi:uncharacterized protein YndB with AHSA1/START domain
MRCRAERAHGPTPALFGYGSRSGALVVAALVACSGLAGAETKEGRCGAFTVTQSVTLPGSPETIYDAVTGDISGWWDHAFSEKPKRFFIEAKPGGGFWELFDDAGNGVRHATVIYADRGKLLRFEGPLGLSGNAVTFVTTYAFATAAGDSTRLDVTAHCAGEYQDAWPAAVDQVWHHFIVERFKPYFEAGKHLKR